MRDAKAPLAPLVNAAAVRPPRPTHVVLIGAMGSGKTAVGRHLARLFRYAFHDSDAEVLHARVDGEIVPGHYYYKRLDELDS